MEFSNVVFGPFQVAITLELNKHAQHTLVPITIPTSKVMVVFLKQNQFNNKRIWKVSSIVISINKVQYFIADLVGSRIVYIGDGVEQATKLVLFPFQLPLILLVSKQEIHIPNSQRIHKMAIDKGQEVKTEVLQDVA